MKYILKWRMCSVNKLVKTEHIINRALDGLCAYAISTKVSSVCPNVLVVQLGDNCIQNFHLGRYIVGYTVGNLVLRRRASGALKRDFRTYIRRYSLPPQMKILNMVIPILMHFCSFVSNWSVESGVMPHVIQRNVT